MKKLCTDCYYIGTETYKVRGNLGIAFLVWLLFITFLFLIRETGLLLPFILLCTGLIYSAYRMTGYRKVCPSCEHATMIPINTPKAQGLIKENNLDASKIGGGYHPSPIYFDLLPPSLAVLAFVILIAL